MTEMSVTHPSMVLETIAPDRAREMLKFNTANFRAPDSRRVKRFAEEMKNGRWSLSGDTIKISDDVLLDGQHRLLACLASGVPFQTFVAYGITASPATMDRGKPRTMSQYLTYAGMNNANVLGSVCRNVVCHDRGFWKLPSFGADHYTDSALIDYAIANQTALDNAIRLAGQAVKGNKMMPQSLAATLIHIGSGRSAMPENDELVSWFWTGMKNGIELKEGDPPLTLRNRLLDNREAKHKMSPTYLRYIATIAWNKAVKGEPIKILRFRTVGPAAYNPPEWIMISGSDDGTEDS